ncbi:MAG: N-acetylmuramoyl-L-alanine amidase [Oscillospiraceae bacterium]|nr:N-acetylmuramoyl-L-alanine amidase [Oscillospiraceae bacterium]
MPRIFLSPSTQEWNPYLTDGQTEESVMNRLTNLMEPYLRASGISFVRNDPARNVAGAIADSNAGKFDVHLALHSNAAPQQFAGILRGIDVYYAPSSRDSELLATILANNLQRIYPLPNQVTARPTESLGEVLRTKAVAVLAEIGYHDNAEDEKWIRGNLDRIAQTLVLSLTDYFGIPFVTSAEPFYGITETGGARLNLRDYPALNGKILTQIPDGTQLILFGETDGWFVTEYNGITGYVSEEYIRLS